MDDVKKKLVDMTREEKKQIVLEKGKRSQWLMCPCCHRGVSLVVKTDEQGEPLGKKKEGGVIFKKFGDQLERRFEGPSGNYYPFFIRCQYGRYGVFTDETKSYTASTLKRIDYDLYKDFKEMLNRCHMTFQ